jgi:hypothetical protein
MTRPEQPVEDPVTGQNVSTPEDEKLPPFSEQLAEQLGGWRGLVESSIPVTVFVIANILLELRPAIIVAVSSGLLIAVFRLFRRQSVRHAVNGLFGIFVGAFIAWRSGDARDFYLPGIFISAGYAVALILSAVFRWPLVGWIWSVVLDGGKTRWREDPVLLRVFGWLTVLWATVYIAKVGIQYGLYLADEESLLGIARIALGWPPYAILLAVTVWSVRRVTRHQQTGAA